MVQDSVLSRIDDQDLVVYSVWEPILRTDNERASRKATMLLPDARVKHYWVSSTAIGEAFQRPIELKTEPAWDVYLLYEPGIVWEGRSPPVPTTFMHQLGGRLPPGMRLDGRALRERTHQTLGRAERGEK